MRRLFESPSRAVRSLAGIAVVLFIVTYVLLLQTKAGTTICGGRFVLSHVPCLLNLNSGVLSLYAVVIAFMTVIVTAWLGATQAFTQMAETTRIERRFDRLLYETTYEAAHNLQHLAATGTAGSVLSKSRARSAHRWQNPQVFARWPEFQTLQARRLLGNEFESLWKSESESLWPHIDHMVRNDGFLRRFSFDGRGLLPAEEFLAYFLEYCVRVMVEAARRSPKGAEVVQRIVTRASRDGLDLEVLSTLVASPSNRYFVRFHSSWARDALAKDRPDTRGAAVALCWINDLGQETIESNAAHPVALHALQPGFARLQDPPDRG